MNIPFFDYPHIYKRFENDFNNIFKDVCSNGSFILQRELSTFEEQLSEYLDVKHAVGVADGTNALIIGLKILGIGKNDEVIISSHTYVATAAAVKLVGATPVFADIGTDGLVCPQSIKNKITTKTKAIMPTQLNGRISRMDQIQEIADQVGAFVLEDSAQGLGAKFKGKSIGSFGPFGTLSFYPAKLIGCFGDGGAIVTNDSEFYEKVLLWRDHGRDLNGDVVAWGTNSRLDNLQAAFLSHRLKHFDEDVKRRREIANFYNDELCNLKELKLPPPPSDNKINFDVYQNYELCAERRNKLKEFLSQKGIGTIIQWAGKPVHHFDELGYGKDKYSDLKYTDWFFERCIMLPMNMSITDKDIQYITACIKEFYLN